MKPSYIFITFAVGLVIGILATTFITLAHQTVYAETSGESSGIIAVTGLCQNNMSGLWVLDARDTKRSPALCLYIPEGGGRNGFRLTGARRIKYDLLLPRYQDATPKGYEPATLQKEVEEMNKKEEEKAAKNK